jgi:DNA-binding FadR family transcriptional regulator
MDGTMKPATRPTLPKGLARSAMQDIGRAIVGGEFRAGSVLPTEEALAARTGVSRAALREAIKVLSGKGLVRTARRYGSQVCPRVEWNTLDPDVLAWHLAEPANWSAFLRDIVEARMLIEPRAASLAALRATPAEIDHIVALTARLPVANSATDIDTDVACHIAVLRASHNSFLAGLAPSMEVALRAYFSAVWKLRPEGPLNVASTNLHQAMANAIAVRDPAAASACMEQMLAITATEVDAVVRLFDAGLSSGAGEVRGRASTARQDAVIELLPDMRDPWSITA